MPETDTIFANIATYRKKKSSGVIKLSIDVKDKVKVGQFYRQGYHRNREHICALDKDQHWDHTLVPLGILEIESGESTIVVGNSHESSDFIVDGLEIWYESNKERIQADNTHTLELNLVKPC